MNESDAEHYAGQLNRLGYTPIDNHKEAEVIIINTCSVRESAELKILGKIGELKHVKQSNPQNIVCITGCMAQKEQAKLLKKFPQIDLIIGTHYVNSFGKLLLDFLSDRCRKAYIDENNSPDALTNAVDEFAGYTDRKSSVAAWVPIMYGCNNFCTYCIVPYVRGRERSRSIENIVQEIKSAVQNGYKEFTLLGQNVNSYKVDGEKKFAELLTTVDKIDGVVRIRYMTSHPRDMDEEVIKVIATSEHICENFHLPLQSGGDATLARMNRGYTAKKYLELIRLVRSYVPQATITTDIIVGFPGETDEDFAGTMEMVRAVEYDMAYTFMYSKRSGTPATEFTDQVPKEVAKERFNRLLTLQNEISLAKNKKLVDQTVEVLFEGESKNDSNCYTGRTRGNKIVLWQASDRNLKIGDLIQIKITDAQTWLLKGIEV